MKKTTHRPVKRVDTSGQLALLIASEAPEAAPTASATRPVIFVEPAPESLQVAGVPLKVHLQQAGVRDVFIIQHLLNQQDWSAFEAAYQGGGRPPYAPRAMMGLILYGVMRGNSSLRELERLARVDLGCWWVTGGILPDHSVIGRFIQNHATLLSGDFFESLTRSILKATRSGVAQTAGDGTVIEAAASRYNLVKREALEKRVETVQQQLADPTPPEGLSEAQAKQRQQAPTRLAALQEAQGRLDERAAKRREKGKDPATTQVNVSEPDAVVQPLKQQGYGSAYKPSVVVNPERIIVAHAVHASSEVEVVPGLLDQAGRQGQLEESSWDAGYHNDTVLEAAEKRTLNLLTPEGRTTSENWNKQSDKQYPKSRFQYDKESDTYRCPAGELLRPVERYQGKPGVKPYVTYGTSACKHCPQAADCTSSENGRRVKRYPGDGRKEAMRKQFEDENVRQRYRKRAGSVEPVFSSIKCRQGLTRFHRKGLAGVTLEFALHVLAHNLGRMTAIGLRMNPVFLRLFLCLSGWAQSLIGAVIGPERRKVRWAA